MMIIYTDTMTFICIGFFLRFLVIRIAISTSCTYSYMAITIASTCAYRCICRVGDQSPDISIIRQPVYTINKCFYPNICIKYLALYMVFVVKILTKNFKLCSYSNAKPLL